MFLNVSPGPTADSPPMRISGPLKPPPLVRGPLLGAPAGLEYAAS
ncbi:hypothetical protein [Deinococcus sp. QL22]|nr:hypothetical protein [Deinococcus sp. QL22]